MQVDNLQEFIDSEIKKKGEKERIKLQRALDATEEGITTKRTWEQEIKEDTKLQESPDDFLRYYFEREKGIMEKIYGTDWKRHLKTPTWPRDKYTVVDEVRGESVSSLDEDRKERRDRKIAAAQAKTKGVITFLQMAEK